MAKTRAEVTIDETWRLEDIFPSPADWEGELKALEEQLPVVARFRGRLLEGPAILLACLKARERLLERHTKVLNYAHLATDVDGLSAEKQARLGLALTLDAKIATALAFIRSELKKMPDGLIEQYLAAEEGLCVYRSWLEEVIAAKRHALSLETEETLAALGETFSAPMELYSRTTAADMLFDPVTGEGGREIPVSLTSMALQIETCPDTAVRHQAYASLTRGLAPYRHTLAANLAAEIKRHVVMAGLRRYSGAVEMLLQTPLAEDHLAPDDVTPEVYENILDVIQAELAPHMRRYARLRRRVLGLDKLLLCDVKASLDAGYEPRLSYDEAADLIERSVTILGDEFRGLVHAALRERWVDRADNTGRAGGAFCARVYGVHPYIMCTFTGSFTGAFGLAHELGHAAHFGLAARRQNLTNTRLSLFFAEVPSTLGEHLLAHQIRQSSQDQRLQRWVAMQRLNTYHHNFVTHLLEAELQRRLYRLAESGEHLTTEVICGLKGEILSEFWGDTVEIDEGARLTWMRQPHYYMGLYPYTYAAGLAGSTSIFQMLVEEGETAARRWLDVLKAGGTRKPLDLFRLAGLDMASPDPLRRAVVYVGGLVDEVERGFDGFGRA